MVSGNRRTDFGLSLLLQRWRVSPRPRPGFCDEVWRRITALQPDKKREPIAKPSLRGRR